MLPIDLYKFEDILEYESTISKKRESGKDYTKAKYKYLEKRSLIEYYKTYYRNIKSGKIFDYIDLNKKYYKDNDYYKKISEMLKCFSEELEKYFENLKR